MPEHIRDHSIMVARIARLITRNLRLKGLPLSLERATAGALLHDIGKILALEKGGDHCEIGRSICVREQCPEVADIVLKHVRFAFFGIPESVSEEEIVYYADKRVNHDKIVPLQERLAYILQRYGKNNRTFMEAIIANFSMCKRVEERLFRPLHFGPEEIESLAAGEPLTEEDIGWASRE